MTLNTNEMVVMNTETLDDDTAVINFDVQNTEEDVTQTGGYVMARKDDNDQCFYVTVINHNGDVISETTVPYIFNKQTGE